MKRIFIMIFLLATTACHSQETRDKIDRGDFDNQASNKAD